MSKQKFHLILLSIFALVIFAAGSGWALAVLDLPQPTGYVNDFAGMLSPQTKGELESKLKSYEEKSGNEIAVVTVPNLQGTTVEDFAVRLFEKWKIGKKGRDNGVLLLVSKEERKIRIEVGYGLEPDLTDAESYGIVRNAVVPAFKGGNFDKGVTDGADAIIKAIAGKGIDTANDNSPNNEYHMSSRGIVASMGWLLLALVFPWLAAIMARTKSWWLGGAVGTFIGLLVMIFSIPAGVITIAVLTPLGLLFDFAISRAFDEHKKRKSHGDDSYIPWWAGGGWGPGSGGSGGGFGGFGGGGSGGGGASGEW